MRRVLREEDSVLSGFHGWGNLREVCTFELGCAKVAIEQTSVELGGGFKHFLFSPLLREMIQVD